MRNTDERVKAALLGAKRMRQKQQLRAITAGSVALSMCLIVVLSCLMPTTLDYVQNDGMAGEFTASVFANSQSLGYIAIGILSFVLGVCVTMVCLLLHKKGANRDDDD